jgi:hypothetical protein
MEQLQAGAVLPNSEFIKEIEDIVLRVNLLQVALITGFDILNLRYNEKRNIYLIFDQISESDYCMVFLGIKHGDTSFTRYVIKIYKTPDDPVVMG